MNVTCPNCATIYRVDPAKVPEAGVRARCSVCSAVFAVRHDAAVTAPPLPRPAPSPPRRPCHPLLRRRTPRRRPPPVAAPAPPAPPWRRPRRRRRQPPAQRHRRLLPVRCSRRARPAHLARRRRRGHSRRPRLHRPRPRRLRRLPPPLRSRHRPPLRPGPSHPPDGPRGEPFLSQDPALKARRLARALDLRHGGLPSRESGRMGSGMGH